MVHLLCLLLSLMCSFALLAQSYANGPSLSQLNKQPGIYKSPDNNCEGLLYISEMGGFSILDVYQINDKQNKHTINDITGIQWISQRELVYTVSPIYGKPGIFLFNCTSNQIKRILAPKTKNQAYPDGADFFELLCFKDKRLYFYYTADVDSVNFKKFRTEAFLYEININGTGFRKLPSYPSCSK